MQPHREPAVLNWQRARSANSNLQHRTIVFDRLAVDKDKMKFYKKLRV